MSKKKNNNKEQRREDVTYPMEKCPHRFYLKASPKNPGGIKTLIYECEMCGKRLYQ